MSSVYSTTHYLECSDNLENCLWNLESYESEDDNLKRATIIDNINNLAREWIREMSASNISNDAIRNVERFIYPLGSYVFGVMEKDSNLDSIFIAPQFIERSEFLQSFSKKLEQSGNIKEVIPIGVARTPQIRIIYNDCELYIVFANIHIDYLTGKKNINNDVHVYDCLDGQTTVSLNGYHFVNDILDIVQNKEMFKIALRVIKLWARRKGLYSRRLGIMGGTSWTILMVYICKKFPRASSSELVHQFFAVFSEWQWPKPVEIKESLGNIKLKGSKYCDFKYSNLYKDRNALMPIITPSFPQNNSAFRITKSMKAIIVEEFKTGLKVVTEILNKNGDWNCLFKACNFFDQYKHFIVITGNTLEENRSTVYSIIESKIRFLTKELDNKDIVERVQVLPDFIDSTSDDDCRMWFVGVRMKNPEVDFPNDLIQQTNKFETINFEKFEEVNLNRNDIDLNTSFMKYEEFSTSLPEDAYHKILERSID